MKRSILLGCALALVFAACAGSRADIDEEFLPGTATSTSRPSAGASTTTTVVAAAGIAGQIDALAGIVGELRGLPVRVPPIEYRPAAELEDRYQELRGLPRTGNSRFDDAFLRMLGVLEPGATIGDLEDFCAIPGFYDPTDRTLVLDERLTEPDALTPFGRQRLVSELVMTATDQAHGWHADSASLTRDGDGEAAVALWGLVSGDAAFHADQYVARELDQTERFAIRLEEIACQQARTPPPGFIVSLEDFGPGAGRSFVEDLISNGGRASLDAAYRSPPVSSEQIYHPSRFTQQEVPLAVELDEVGAPGFEEQLSGTLGERMFRAILSEGVSTAQALQAATGWGGDRYRLLWDGSDAVLVAVVEGDEARDARELAETIGGWASASMRVGSGRPDNTGLAFEGEQYAFVAHNGSTMLLVLSSDAGAGRSVRDRFWPSW